GTGAISARFRRSEGGRFGGSWGASYTKILAALQRADDLDLVSGREPCAAPLGTADNGAIDGDGEKPRRGVDAALGEQLRDRRHREFGLLAVDPQRRHCAAASICAGGAKRSGLKGRASSESRPVRTNSLITAAVAGVNRIPLRWCPVAMASPSIPLGPSIGASSREPGRKPTQVSAIGNSSIAGTARHAPSSRARSPPAVRLVSKPRSSTVPPTISRPSSRGTM